METLIILAIAIFGIFAIKNTTFGKKVFSLINASAHNQIKKLSKTIGVLEGKLDILHEKKNAFIKSIARMKAVEISNLSKKSELESEIDKYTKLSKSYKDAGNEEKAMQSIRILSNKKLELNAIESQLNSIRLSISDGENKLQQFGQYVSECESKISILRNKYETSEMLGEMTDIDGDLSIKELIKDLNIDFDTKIIASDIKMEESKIDFEIMKQSEKDIYDSL